jgi:hypothetical protein
MKTNPNTEPACPECEKMQKVKDRSQAIGEFLEWLQEEKALQLCEWDGLYKMMPVDIPTEKLLAEFFDIDLNKVEQEKRAILDYMRAQHG